jgi:HEPN domain-containing protein
MIALYDSERYVSALFFGHLVIEKLLKAHYVKAVTINVPKIHNLLILADKIGLKLTKEQENILKDINTFNIAARYNDAKFNFYKKCTKEYTKKNIEMIEELRKWLKEKIIQ